MPWAIVFLVAVHLLAVNLAGAGPLVAAFADWRGTRRGSSDFLTVARQLALSSLAAVGIGVALGLLALAVVTTPGDDGNRSEYALTLKQVPAARWWFTGAEVIFYLACMTGYVWMLERPQSWVFVRRLLAIAAGTNLLYHFPALFTILAIVPTRPALIGVTLDTALYRRLLIDPETMARVAHVWMASFSVAGLALAWIDWRRSRLQGTSSKNGSMAAAVVGGRIALASTLLQIPLGIWALTTLPSPQQDRVLGGNATCTLLLGSSVLASFALLHQLAMLALGDARRNRLIATTILMTGIILLMTATLQLARS